MLSLRARLIAGGLAAGVALGALLWLTLDKGAPMTARLDDLQSRLSAMRAPTAPTASFVDTGSLAAAPIFVMTTGPGAVTEPTILLQGLARTPRRSAALLAINGKPAAWLELGATVDGVTLQEVGASKVVVDTVTGLKEVSLGEKTAPAGGSPAGSSTSAAAPPPGFRSPPPPANAPVGG